MFRLVNVITHAAYIRGGEDINRDYMRSHPYWRLPRSDYSGRALRLPEGVMSCMATYTVIPKVDHTGFHVAIVGSDGVRQTILGFDTRADAEAWILRDKWLSAADRPGIPPEPMHGADDARLLLLLPERTRPHPVSGRYWR